MLSIRSSEDRGRANFGWLDGALKHQDSMGNGSVIRPGDVQRMTAGTGVRHSEYNASDTDDVHLLQIWILPEKAGLQPGYEEKRFTREDKLNRLRLVGSRDGRDNSVIIHQDVNLYAGILEPGRSVQHTLGAGRRAWIQLTGGSASLNGRSLAAGDGVASDSPGELEFTAFSDAGLLLFDMR